jgi:hypothetical protein
MIPVRSKTLTVTVLALLAVGVGFSSMIRGDDPIPALPADTLAGDVTVVYAQPFVLDTPFTHYYRAEQPQYSAGMLMVIEVEDRALIHPRQTYEPVLFVGGQTAERINFGTGSGRLVIVVPAALAADGSIDLDLTSGPIFFGEPALPEQIDSRAAQIELDRALARGLSAPSARQLLGVMHDRVSFPDQGELHAYAASLVETWSPQEVDLVAGLRAQRITR